MLRVFYPSRIYLIDLFTLIKVIWSYPELLTGYPFKGVYCLGRLFDFAILEHIIIEFLISLYNLLCF